MNHQELYKLLTTVQKNVRCPQCGKEYNFSFIQIRGIVDSVVFLELNCSNHMPLLATVNLTKGQTIKRDLPKVNSEDVIGTYHFLKTFNGSFEELFNKDINKK